MSLLIQRVNCSFRPHSDDKLLETLERIEHKLDLLLKQEKQLATTLDALTLQVAQQETVEASAITLIQGLAAQIAANTTDPVALAALVARLQSSATALGAAITANTPAAPAPTA